MSRDRTPRKWNGETAQAYGCIVSFEGDHGAELTLHLDGGRMDFTSRSGHRVDAASPEAAALSNVGLGHMAHPRLRLGRGDNEAQANRRARGQRAQA